MIRIKFKKNTYIYKGVHFSLHETNHFVLLNQSKRSSYFKTKWSRSMHNFQN